MCYFLTSPLYTHTITHLPILSEDAAAASPSGKGGEDGTGSKGGTAVPETDLVDKFNQMQRGGDSDSIVAAFRARMQVRYSYFLTFLLYTPCIMYFFLLYTPCIMYCV